MCSSTLETIRLAKGKGLQRGWVNDLGWLKLGKSSRFHKAINTYEFCTNGSNVVLRDGP